MTLNARIRRLERLESRIGRKLATALLTAVQIEDIQRRVANEQELDSEQIKAHRRAWSYRRPQYDHLGQRRKVLGEAVFGCRHGRSLGKTRTPRPPRAMHVFGYLLV